MAQEKIVSQSEIIPLSHDYDDAVEQAAKKDRPLLVILGAEWCGPCKVLEKELEKPVAESIFRKWIVVKVDIDQEPGLAREWNVNAVPAFRILGNDLGVLASNEGFGGSRKLQSWLDEQFDTANPRTQRLFQDNAPIDADIVKDLIALLKDRSPSNRRVAIRRLGQHREIAVDGIIQALFQGNLSQKICSLEILENWKAPVKEVDPWEMESITEEQTRRLREWRQELDSVSEREDANAESPSTLDSSIEK